MEAERVLSFLKKEKGFRKKKERREIREEKKNTRNTICPTFLFACETKRREIFFQCQFGDKDNTARARG